MKPASSIWLSPFSTPSLNVNCGVVPSAAKPSKLTSVAVSNPLVKNLLPQSLFNKFVKLKTSADNWNLCLFSPNLIAKSWANFRSITWLHLALFLLRWANSPLRSLRYSSPSINASSAAYCSSAVATTFPSSSRSSIKFASSKVAGINGNAVKSSPVSFIKRSLIPPPTT